MITVEYRVPLPLSLDEYSRALRYVVARVAESTTGVNPGEGVEILVNEPFGPADVPGMPDGGVHTVKLLRFRSRLPALLRRVLPYSVTEINEESWFSNGSGSRCKTVYRNPFLGERFYLSIESNHIAGIDTDENAVDLQRVDLARRTVIYLDIAGNVPRKLPTEDPSTYVSEKTGRGKLMPGWWKDMLADQERADASNASSDEDEEFNVDAEGATGEQAEDEDEDEDEFVDASAVRASSRSEPASSSEGSASSVEPAPLDKAHCMTCYKVVKMEFTGFGMRRFVQRWTTRAVVPNSLIDIHRKLFCWMDEWSDLTIEQIQELEQQTAETTRAILQKHDSGEIDDCTPAAGAAAVSAFEYEYVDET